MSVIAFDASAHAYKVNGQPLLSVTQALTLAGLIDATWHTPEARDRGTAVHEAIAAGTVPELLDEALAPYVLAWRRFLRESGATVLAQEQRVADVLSGYAGTYDVRLQLPGDPRETIADLKTGPHSCWHGCQLAAYARALSLVTMKSYNRMVIGLRNDGSYSTQSYIDRSDEKTFLAALRVAQWKREKGIA